MTSNIDFPIVFDFEGLPVRTVDLSGEAWFVASDVAKALEYRDAEVATRHLDDDEKAVHLLGVPGGPRQLTLISESGLYSMILRSRKAEAKKFKKWITSEVLPCIRKTGGYNQPQNVPRLSTLTRNSLTLLHALKKETNPDARRYLHEQLTITSRMIGVQPPALDAIGGDATEVPSMVDDFWAVYDDLTTGNNKVNLNHSVKTGVIAVSLIEVYRHASARKIDLPRRPEVAQALRLSKDPQFLESTKTVRNAEGRTVRCWIFKASTS